MIFLAGCFFATYSTIALLYFVFYPVASAFLKPPDDDGNLDVRETRGVIPKAFMLGGLLCAPLALLFLSGAVTEIFFIVLTLCCYQAISLLWILILQIKIAIMQK